MRTVGKDSAFTLIEVLIVVVIMAVLAATVIPQFASSTKDAKESSLKFNMHTLRSQIELYKIHHGEYPELDDKNSLPQLLGKTDSSGIVKSDGEFGPYLDGQIPPNPFDGVNLVFETTETAPTEPVGDGEGWQYNETTGGIWPNNPEFWTSADDSGNEDPEPDEG